MGIGKTVIAGLILAVVAALTISFGEALGLDLERSALVGVACGAVLGLVGDRGPFARLLAFAGGFLIAWLGYGVRALLLPDTANGRAVGAFLVIALCTGLAAATLARLPFWAILLGVAAMAGAYETTFMASQPDFLRTSPVAATTSLLAAAIGFAVTVYFGEQAAEESDADRLERPPDRSPDEEENTSFSSLMAPKSEA